MEILKEYVRPELLVLLPVLYFVGKALKKSEQIGDKHIPLLLGVVGMVLSLVWVLATGTMVGYRDVLLALFTAATQGILAAGLSVYVHQLWKQEGKDE